MGCLRVKLRDLGRYQKKYSLVRNEPVLKLISDRSIEMETLIVDIIDSDQVTVNFTVPFSEIPAVVANIMTQSSNVGSVNVYAFSVNKTTAVIKTSAPITGKISIQAIYIQEE